MLEACCLCTRTFSCEARPSLPPPSSHSALTLTRESPIWSELRISHDLQALCIRKHGVKLPSNVKILWGGVVRDPQGALRKAPGSCAFPGGQPHCTHVQATFFIFRLSAQENPSLPGSLTRPGFLPIYWVIPFNICLISSCCRGVTWPQSFLII